eukprot:CAMPEP_0181231286 /NCGR_PEP_ID=MMETSP1096-20121128/35009_1 /TAXON_ID=156174 ORGANISM="Chrysochromulina ericina, Strain CCMP281" /NCGR_SAMPLE_ID=MMETSP1096 /ASSEMBLY_ACC=CAM_ASM_000453 /LENGTH=94 /DNA_ID=CAMNT_0023325285 /DNA_START=153 /DNA_END=433 /DNA_ORIENTATION=+
MVYYPVPAEDSAILSYDTVDTPPKSPKSDFSLSVLSSARSGEQHALHSRTDSYCPRKTGTYGSHTCVSQCVETAVRPVDHGPERKKASASPTVR